MTNAEALAQMEKMNDLYCYGHKAAAERLSREIGADFLYLYWLPRNYDANPEESIRYTPDRRAAVEHTRRKIEDEN